MRKMRTWAGSDINFVWAMGCSIRLGNCCWSPVGGEVALGLGVVVLMDWSICLLID